MNKKDKLAQIKKEVLSLRSSPLYKFRQENKYLPVIGEGSLNAKVIFLGEAPGKNEAEQGRPFIGAAGKMLDELLKKAGLTRKEVYISSILFDRPPKNRNPKPEEITVYKPFLKKIINLIEPEVVVTLGNFAIKTLSKEYYFADKFHTLSMDHGQPIEIKIEKRQTIIYPTYHPAAVFYNRTLEDTLNKDFSSLKKYQRKI